MKVGYLFRDSKRSIGLSVTKETEKAFFVKVATHGGSYAADIWVPKSLCKTENRHFEDTFDGKIYSSDITYVTEIQDWFVTKKLKPYVNTSIFAEN